MLIVDDELSILQWLVHSLHQFGYDAIQAADADTALMLLQDSPVHALVLDVRLVGHSGLKVLEYVRSTEALVSLPVIILTGVLHLNADEEETIRRHRAYVFYKPQGVEAIIDYLNRLLLPPMSPVSDS